MLHPVLAGCPANADSPVVVQIDIEVKIDAADAACACSAWIVGVALVLTTCPFVFNFHQKLPVPCVEVLVEGTSLS